MMGTNQAQVDALVASGSAAAEQPTTEASQIPVESFASGGSSRREGPSPDSALKKTHRQLWPADGDIDAKKIAGEQEMQMLRDE